MASVLDLHAYEKIQQRRSPSVRTSVILYTRIYDIPPQASHLVPAKGDAVTLPGVTGEGIEQPRVYDISKDLTPGAGTRRLAITFYQIRPYGE